MAQDKSNVQNLGEAISVLVQAVNIAQSKGGVYSFSDAAKINSALNFIEEVSEQQAPKAEVKTEEIDKSIEEK